MTTNERMITAVSEPRPMLRPRQIAGLDRVEMDLWRGLGRRAPEDLRRVVGLRVRQMDGVTAIATSSVDVLAFNRVVGLGLRRPATGKDLDEIIEFYRTHGCRRLMVQLNPRSAPESLTDRLIERGFTHHNNWAKLYRPVGEPRALESAIRVEEVRVEETAAVVRMIAPIFDWPVSIEPIIEGLLGQPRWRLYVARDGGTPIGAAALGIRGRYGYLAFAATLPRYRGRGAETALISRRMIDATAAGCDWLVSETAEDRFERPAPAFRNMIRAGFQLAYLRRNFVLTF